MSGKHALTAGVGESLDTLDIGLGEERVGSLQGPFLSRHFSVECGGLEIC